MEHKESAEQQIFIEWCRMRGEPYSLIFSIENEGRTTPQAGVRAKRMGKVAGIPDLFLPHASGKYNGLFIEMKAKGGRVSLPQKEIISKLRREGYAACVCYGADEAIDAINQYMDLERGDKH